MRSARSYDDLTSFSKTCALADEGIPSVSVRINDRCAGVHKIIDLSEAAARRLQMMRAGIVPVRLEVLSRPTRP